MGHKKHGHCPYAQMEDAPKVLGNASISKWAVGATTERQISWLGGSHKNGGNKILLGN